MSMHREQPELPIDINLQGRIKAYMSVFPVLAWTAGTRPWNSDGITDLRGVHYVFSCDAST